MCLAAWFFPGLSLNRITKSHAIMGRQMDDEIRNKILALLDQHRIMTIATLRPDGWPQATTVGYVNEGLTLYFLCGLDSQKAANLARDDRVSLTIDHDTPDLMAITGMTISDTPTSAPAEHLFRDDRRVTPTRNEKGRKCGPFRWYL